jgi:hypothetical protein
MFGFEPGSRVIVHIMFGFERQLKDGLKLHTRNDVCEIRGSCGGEDDVLGCDAV